MPRTLKMESFCVFALLADKDHDTVWELKEKRSMTFTCKMGYKSKRNQPLVALYLSKTGNVKDFRTR